jgi:hypothetical protein
LQKESTREIVVNSLPNDLDDLEEYFPDEELQEALKTKKDKTKDAMCDMFYGMHEVRYKEWLHEHSKVSSQLDALEYFKWRMNCKRDMRVICDRRRLMQMSLALHEYAMEITAPTAEERRQYLRENTEYDYSAPLR